MKIEDCKVGMKVLFGRSHGEQTTGEIVKVNGVKCKVKQLESRGTMKSYPVGTIWTVPASLMSVVGYTTPFATTPVAPAPAKRSRPEVMRDIQDCYTRLSPENLSCDGECSRSQVSQRRANINARLKVLFVEFGRRVLEDEAFDNYMPSQHGA